MTTFRTEVFYAPPSPLGLVGNHWVVQHRCTTCHQRVPGDQLLTHAQDHGDDERIDHHDA
ncbi:MAG TPA: hypothetical protein VFO65_09560 [Acidimicrobiales bacterium]|nr:hypothetical protein [Acidimicrobiales bacterium]